MPVGVELRAGRKLIDALIKAEPTELVLTRPGVVTENVEGGQVAAPPTFVPAQQFRKSMMKRRYMGEINSIEEGKIQAAREILIGRWNCDVQRGDYWTAEGFNYRVEGISADSARRSQVDRVIIELEVRKLAE